jgi:hypothetical protein
MKRNFSKEGILKGARPMMKVEVAKKPCAFVLNIIEPLETVIRVILLFSEKGTIIEKMQMHRLRTGDAILIVHCLVEKESFADMEKKLGSIEGIGKIERV